MGHKYDKFSGAPPKCLCCQGEDKLFLCCQVDCRSKIAVAKVVRGNVAQTQRFSPHHQPHQTSFFRFIVYVGDIK